MSGAIPTGAIPPTSSAGVDRPNEKGARIVSTDGVTHVSTHSTPCECPRVPLARIASTDGVQPTRGLCTCKRKGHRVAASDMAEGLAPSGVAYPS